MIKQQKKKNTDVVVIFKRRNKQNLTLFEPQYLTIGTIDENTLLFKDLEGNTYTHFSLGNEHSLYGYGLRISLKELRELYRIKNIPELFKIYLKELKERKYYFQYNEKRCPKLIFISEDKKYHNILEENDIDLNKILKTNDPFYNINTLLNSVKSNIIGQDEPIEDIVSIIWRNSKKENKSNILMLGPTGVGKTEIIRTISKKLNIPLSTVDVSNFTQTGYQGDSVKDILKKVINDCNGNVALAETSIVILDEFDKLATNSSSNESVATKGVQQELLKLIEDGEYNVELSDSLIESQTVKINTKGITFIAIGAFSNLFEEEEIKNNTIGFNSVITKPQKYPKKNIKHEDIIKYGFIRELIGRFHNIIILNSLTKENLIEILKSNNSHLLNEDIKLLQSIGINVHISEEVYDEIAEEAINKKIGARGLIGSIDSLFTKAAIEAKKEEGKYDYLEITKETLKDNKKYILKKVTKRKELP